jgi:hypothetical protein
MAAETNEDGEFDAFDADVDGLAIIDAFLPTACVCEYGCDNPCENGNPFILPPLPLLLCDAICFSESNLILSG